MTYHETALREAAGELKSFSSGLQAALARSWFGSSSVEALHKLSRLTLKVLRLQERVASERAVDEETRRREETESLKARISELERKTKDV